LEVNARLLSKRYTKGEAISDEKMKQLVFTNHKWNKVEHRLFSFISSNWRGEPLRDYETVVDLIAQTTTAKGLTVICRLDRRKYPTGRKVTADEMKQVNLHPDRFHGEWNYVIKPRSPRQPHDP
jgi:hypothetical protein